MTDKKPRPSGLCCPSCGQSVADVAPIEALRHAPLSQHERRIVEALADAYPRALGRNPLIDALYFDDPNGGVENARVIVAIVIMRIRKKLPAYGWTIPKCKAGKGNRARYRLEPVETIAKMRRTA